MSWPELFTCQQCGEVFSTDTSSREGMSRIHEFCETCTTPEMRDACRRFDEWLETTGRNHEET